MKFRAVLYFLVTCLVSFLFFMAHITTTDHFVLGKSINEFPKRLERISFEQKETKNFRFNYKQAQQPYLLSQVPPVKNVNFACEPRQTEVYQYSGGVVSYCKKKNFPITENDTARVEIKPNSARTPHWHNTWEQQVLISGKAKTILIDPKGKLYEQKLESGTIVFIPSGWTHWSENMGEETATFIFIFPHDFQTFEVLDSVVTMNPSIMESMLGLKNPKFTLNHDILIKISN